MIKKIISGVSILALVSTVFISCASKPKEKPVVAEPVPTAKPIIGMDGVPMPTWVNKTPKSDDKFYAVGYAMKSNRAISKTAAGADARDQIARWVGTSVKNALVNYTNESGSEKNVQTLSYFENISKQVADQTLVGVEDDETWVDDKGGVYMLCSFPKANVGKSFEQTVQSFQRNEAAAFSEFKAKEALSFLDKETTNGVTATAK
ncbi:MAG TPA: LPP20 family lipoprotein [Treponemataceae bacterium]|nr:LPP20 family lipoprotein [Treponemataceae bacterium]HPS44196.1 LPP20 family lipoprotein [Treponemataceae bacterium]